MEMEEMEQSSRYRKYKKSMTGMTAIGPVLTFWLIPVSNFAFVFLTYYLLRFQIKFGKFKVHLEHLRTLYLWKVGKPKNISV